MPCDESASFMPSARIGHQHAGHTAFAETLGNDGGHGGLRRVRNRARMLAPGLMAKV